MRRIYCYGEPGRFPVGEFLHKKDGTRYRPEIHTIPSLHWARTGDPVVRRDLPDDEVDDGLDFPDDPQTPVPALIDYQAMKKAVEASDVKQVDLDGLVEALEAELDRPVRVEARLREALELHALRARGQRRFDADSFEPGDVDPRDFKPGKDFGPGSSGGGFGNFG